MRPMLCGRSDDLAVSPPVTPADHVAPCTDLPNTAGEPGIRIRPSLLFFRGLAIARVRRGPKGAEMSDGRLGRILSARGYPRNASMPGMPLCVLVLSWSSAALLNQKRAAPHDAGLIGAGSRSRSWRLA